MVNSTFCSDAEINEYIQSSYGEYYDLLIESIGPQHFLSSLQGVTTAGDADLELAQVSGSGVGENLDNTLHPVDIYKILRVEATINGVVGRLRPTTIAQREETVNVTGGWTDHHRVGYFLYTDINGTGSRQHQVMHFEPTPQAAHTITIFYIPAAPTLIESQSSFSSPTFPAFPEAAILTFTNWSEYIVVDAAMKCLEKEESDTTALMMRKEALRQRIVWHGNTMNADDAGSVRDLDSEYMARFDSTWRYR